MKSPAKRRGPGPSQPPVIDPYLPNNGNFGYRVSRYDLELEYKLAGHRLSGTATITAITLASLQAFTLDLADNMSVIKVTVNGQRPAQYRNSAGKLRIRLQNALPAGSAMTIVVRYGARLGPSAACGRSRLRGTHRRNPGGRSTKWFAVVVPLR